MSRVKNGALEQRKSHIPQSSSASHVELVTLHPTIGDKDKRCNTRQKSFALICTGEVEIKNTLQISQVVFFLPPTTLSNLQRTFPCQATWECRAGCNYAQNQTCVTALINGNTPYQSNRTTLEKQLSNASCQLYTFRSWKLVSTRLSPHLISGIIKCPLRRWRVGFCSYSFDFAGSRSPWRDDLKLKDWKPPVRAEESMTSTPYSLWLFRYSVTATTSKTTVTTPAARPE